MGWIITLLIIVAYSVVALQFAARLVPGRYEATIRAYPSLYGTDEKKKDARKEAIAISLLWASAWPVMLPFMLCMHYLDSKVFRKENDAEQAVANAKLWAEARMITANAERKARELEFRSFDSKLNADKPDFRKNPITGGRINPG